MLMVFFFVLLPVSSILTFKRSILHHPFAWEGPPYFPYLCITSTLSAQSLLPPTVWQHLICNTEKLTLSASCIPLRALTVSKWSKMAKCKAACNWSHGCMCERKVRFGRTAPFSALHPHHRGLVLLGWVIFCTCSSVNTFNLLSTKTRKYCRPTKINYSGKCIAKIYSKLRLYPPS